MIWIAILFLALVAGTVGGLIGFGSSIILMPALVLTLGPKSAVPVLAIAGLMANFSRAAVWWRVIEWRVVAAFSLTAIPAAALGARTLIALDARHVQIALGVFFLALIPLRRWLRAAALTIGLWGMAGAGAGIGFLSGVVSTVGPINTPFFLAYGLVKGPFVSTEAMASALMGLAKTGIFRSFGALPADIVVKGLIVGSATTVGSWLSKQLMAKIDTDRFQLLMDVVLFGAGAVMLAGAR